MRVLRFRSAGAVLMGGFLLFLLASTPHAFALSNGQAAGLVIGQPSLTSFAGGANSKGLVGPEGIAFDSSRTSGSRIRMATGS